MHCGKCGKPIQNNKPFCAGCGTQAGKGTNNCVFCGKSLRPNAKFCTIDSYKVGTPLQPVSPTCQNCLRPITQSQCTICGNYNPVKVVPPVPPKPLPAPPIRKDQKGNSQPPTQPPKPKAGKCIHCQYQNGAGIRYCIKCHKPIPIPIHVSKEKESISADEGFSSVVGPRGRVTIPSKVREILNINEGNVVTFRVENNRAVITKSGTKKGKKG